MFLMMIIADFSQIKSYKVVKTNLALWLDSLKMEVPLFLFTGMDKLNYQKRAMKPHQY